MKNPLVTVIIPVYNVEKYVAKAILSICNQTYKKLQIIVVDDCSTDKTYEIVEKLAINEKRILLLRNNTNSKIVRTLNYGLKYAKGEYIARMDGDDICSQNRIEKQLNYLISNPEFSLVGSHVYTIDESDKKIGKLRLPTNYLKIIKNIEFSSPILHIWLAKAEVYHKLNGYREIPGAEDYDFLLRMCTEGFKFTNLDSYEYSVRLRDGNTTSTIGFNQRLMSNYVVKLYQERVKMAKDSYSNENVFEYLQEHQKYKLSFDKSNSFLLKAVKAKASKEVLKMLYFIALSVFTSKYQFQYLLKRLIFKLKSGK